MNLVTPEIKAHVKAAILQHLTYSEFRETDAGKQWGAIVKPAFYRDTKSTMKRMGELVVDDRAPTMEEILGDDFIMDIARAEREKTEISALKAENKRLRSAVGDVHSLVSEMKLGEYLPDLVLPKPSVKKGDVKSTLILPLYDLHIGHTVHTPLTEYGPDVFAQRCVDLSEKLSRDIEGLSKSREFEKLVIIFGGDIIEGRTVFKGQSKESVPIQYQLVRGPEVLIQGLLAPLITQFPEVDIFSVPGNHGRLGDKNEFEKVDDNLDIIFCEMVRLRLAGVSHVTWHEPDNMFVYFQLYEHFFLASHGDGFKAWGGVPFYGASKYRSKMQDVLHNRIDALIVGHHHNPADFGMGYGKVVMMNNWVGTNDYAASMGLGGPASQKVLVVDETNPTQTVLEYRFNEGTIPQTVQPVKL